VFVLNPDSLDIRWWYIGAGDGQHDPDWHSDGTISIFNNNYRAYRRGRPVFSEIISIDPAANTHRTLVDGEPYNFHSNFNGHHHTSEAGTVLITSSTQGRVFEVDLKTGENVFDFLNAYDRDEGRMLHLSETFTISEARAQQWLQQDCTTQTQNGETTQ